MVCRRRDLSCYSLEFIVLHKCADALLSPPDARTNEHASRKVVDGEIGVDCGPCGVTYNSVDDDILSGAEALAVIARSSMARNEDGADERPLACLSRASGAESCDSGSRTVGMEGTSVRNHLHRSIKRAGMFFSG
jgi:hypothetical protein